MKWISWRWKFLHCFCLRVFQTWTKTNFIKTGLAQARRYTAVSIEYYVVLPETTHPTNNRTAIHVLNRNSTTTVAKRNCFNRYRQLWHLANFSNGRKKGSYVSVCPQCTAGLLCRLQLETTVEETHACSIREEPPTKKSSSSITSVDCFHFPGRLQADTVWLLEFLLIKLTHQTSESVLSICLFNRLLHSFAFFFFHFCRSTKRYVRKVRGRCPSYDSGFRSGLVFLWLWWCSSKAMYLQNVQALQHY